MFKSRFEGYAYSYPHKTAYRPLVPAVRLNEVWDSEPTDSLFLYLHIPFCEFRCGFCNLFTHAQPEQSVTKQYLEAVERQANQIKRSVPDAQFSQLAIGGGTPTFLSLDELRTVFRLLTQTLGGELASIPVSIEASPATVDREKLTYLRDQGVDRLSMGVQSFKKQETGSIGRPQDPDSVHRAIELIKTANFPIMNLDLIYGAEGQSTESWMDSVITAVSYVPEEIYLYPLYVRELTGLARRNSKQFNLVGNAELDSEIRRERSELNRDDELCRLRNDWDEQRLEAYRVARDFLLANGYEQTSLRMFRRSDSRKVDSTPSDDTVYRCQADGMIGLGCGARSYTHSLHYSYEYAVHSKAILAIVNDFNRKSESDFARVDFGYRLNEEDRKRRFVILCLLQTAGVDTREYHRQFGSRVREDFPGLNGLMENNYLIVTEDRMRLTESGLEYSDAIGPWLYSEQVRQNMKAYECR